MKRFNLTLGFLTTILLFVSVSTAQAQYCDSLVPSFNVDLSASPSMTWISPSIVRNGSCCGSTNPDVCLEFVITLNPQVIAISFNIASGAVPPGALYYQIDCGPPVQVGDPICLYGPGPHTLTFCKPGNNANTFSIISYPDPLIGPDITLNSGCQGFIYGNYYDESTVNWTSIAPGPQGAYDNLLSCTSGCDTTYVTAPVSAPPYVDYYVCGMDIAGCNPNPICDTIRVYFIPPVQVQLTSVDASLCPGQTTIINANASGGSGSYTYNWNTGESTSSITTISGQYYVDVTDSSGCYVASDTITVGTFPLPAVVAGADQVVCDGAFVVLTGSGANSYTWNNGIIDGTPFTQSVGSVNYIVTGTDANGCTNTDTVNVQVNPLPNVNAGSDQEVCLGESVVLNAQGALSYAWTNNIFNGMAFTPPLGLTTYSVTGTDANGCTNFDNVNITVNPLPIIDAGPDQEVCEGSNITLTANGGANISWDNSVSNGIAFNPPLGSTSYIVTGENAYGCVNSDTVNVMVWTNPIVTAQDVEICLGEPVVLSGQGANFYEWNGGITDNEEFYPDHSEVFTVLGTDIHGCTDKAQAMVTVHSLPVVNFKIMNMSLTTLDPTTSFDNLTVGGQTYSWDFGDGSAIDNAFEPTHTFPDIGGQEYAITLTSVSEFGCIGEATKYIHIFNDYTIYVPNAFTPDHDDYNQVFKPVMQGFDPYSYTLYIFDRWGELIFESHDMEVGWDGTYARQNFDVQEGTYTWKIIADLEYSSDTKIFVGHVNLLK